MRVFPTILLTLVALGLGGLVVMQRTTGNLDFIFGSPAKQIGGMVYQFNPAEVGRIEIRNEDGTKGVLVKKGNLWSIETPWVDDADARTVKSLIDFAARMQIEDVIKRDSVGELADFGLEKSRIEVELFDKSGKPLCHFKMGRYTSWRAYDPTEEVKPGLDPSVFPTLIIQPFEPEGEDYLYVCADIVDPNIRDRGIRSLFDENLRAFRGHQVFYNTPFYAAEITLKEKNSEIVLKRQDLKKETPWRIAKPFELATSPEAIEKLMVGIARLDAGQVVDESDLALPDPLPDNIDHSISIRYFMPDGSQSEAVTANFYPPASAQSPFVPVLISEGTKKRSAILLVPRTPGSPLAGLPRKVNELRSRTLTSLAVKQVKGVDVSGPDGRSVALSLEFDPHERAPRWHALAGQYLGTEGKFREDYRGPASIVQTGALFESLFKDEVVGFTNDAATDPKKYGFEQPRRRIRITLDDKSIVDFVIGEQLLPHYYARRAEGGRPLEISAEAYQTGLDGKEHRELTDLPPGDATVTAPQELALLGLDTPKTAWISSDGVAFEVHLGEAPVRHLYANSLDSDGRNTSHVIEIRSDLLMKMELESFHWRTNRLWNINPFDIRGLRITRQSDPSLELEYNFYSQVWHATQSGKDVTALLNQPKAEKLLKKLSDIRIQHWLGPDAENARSRLQVPTFEITVYAEEIDEDGENERVVPHTLSLSQIVPGVPNQLYYGRTSEDPNYFLIDVATVKRLAVILLEEK